ncbi:vesicle-associated membrane protein-associated protein A-like isoform X1 [Centruroides sculpturatus]|uniref:vesicle-associated membrane protein-associated protein A-like isoform X1 n=1 Tax=Centruroides sculpturatus TaxID=218467 RepID=UPI000C6DBE94|nr:vesicle-associated membrane protein-associated protein A-like isoform X1 [Centruroides sculpturatus]
MDSDLEEVSSFHSDYTIQEFEESIIEEFIITPSSELIFHGPFEETSTSQLKLFNMTKNTKCFKIKTLEPSKYRVKPRCGIIRPEEFRTVQISLLPNQVNEFLNKQKFLVQVVDVADSECDPLSLWKDVNPGDVFSKKLHCIFTEERAIFQKDIESSSVYEPSAEFKDLLDLEQLRFQNNEMQEELEELKNIHSSILEEFFPDSQMQIKSFEEEIFDPRRLIISTILFVIFFVIGMMSHSCDFQFD